VRAVGWKWLVGKGILLGEICDSQNLVSRKGAKGAKGGLSAVALLVGGFDLLPHFGSDSRIPLPAGWLLVLVAELAASWCLWTRFPTDSIRVWYPSFWAYEAGRFSGWTIIFVISALLSILFLRGRTGRWWWVVATGFAFGLELSTSVWYWAKPASRDVRGMYESIWYWSRVPLPADKGWRSFSGYSFDHAFAWGVVILTAGVIFRPRRRRRAVDLTVR
jgi:hypothetical protein